MAVRGGKKYLSEKNELRGLKHTFSLYINRTDCVLNNTYYIVRVLNNSECVWGEAEREKSVFSMQDN